MKTQSGPCPKCGGKDRFIFITQPRNGSAPFWFCNQCRYSESTSATSAPPIAPRTITPQQIDDSLRANEQLSAICAGYLYAPAGKAALDYLYQRGFTDATIQAAGLGFHPDVWANGAARELYDQDQAAYEAGSYTGLYIAGAKLGPFLRGVVTIPYHDGTHTTLIRTRALDDKASVKYRSPNRRELGLYAGATPSLYGQDVLTQVDTVLLTEGEFKALAVTQAWRAGTLTMPAVAQPGITSFYDEYADALARKTVIICYDSEQRSDPRRLSPGEMHTIRTGERLTGLGLKGKIDRLTSQHKKMMKDDKHDPQAAKKISDAIDAAKAALDQAQQRAINVKVLRLPRPADCPKVDLDGYLLEHGPAALQSLIDTAQPFTDWWYSRGQCDYAYKHGGMWNGTKLSNYEAIIIEDVTLDDGIAQTTMHRLALWTPAGQRRTADIAADDWADTRKAMQAVRASLHDGTADDEGPGTLKAIKALSFRGDGPNKRTEYTATGWVQIAGRWHYLTPDGSINAQGVSQQHRCSLEPSMAGNHYAICGAGDEQAGAAAFVELLSGKASEQSEALILAGQAALALIHRFIGDQGRPALWIYGGSGGLKTSLVRVFLSLFGPGFTQPHGDGGALPKWDSTANALELVGFTYRDVLYCIDDYKQATAAKGTLAKVLHNYSEGASRGRMTQDLKTQRSFPARGIMVGTGEDRSSGDTGQLARVILYAHGERTVDERPGGGLELAQRAGRDGHLAAFWRGFVQMIAATIDQYGAAGLQKKLEAMSSADDKSIIGHGRTINGFRQNRTAITLLLRWMERCQYITSDQHQALLAAHSNARLNLADEQRDAMQRDRPAGIVLDVLRGQLASELAYITDDDPLAIASIVRPHRGEEVGFLHMHKGERCVALLRNETFGLVQRSMADQRQPILYSQNAIGQQLKADNKLAATDNGRSTTTFSVRRNGMTLRVWLIAEDVLYGKTEYITSDEATPVTSVTRSPNQVVTQNIPLQSHKDEGVTSVTSVTSKKDKNIDLSSQQADPLSPASTSHNGANRDGNTGNTGNTSDLGHSNHVKSVTSGFAQVVTHGATTGNTRPASQPAAQSSPFVIWGQAAECITTDDLAGYEALRAAHPRLDWAGHDDRYKRARQRLGLDPEPDSFTMQGGT